MTNLTNLKTALEINLEIELEAWTNGEKSWNINNQFDETILEKAIAAIQVCDFDKVCAGLGDFVDPAKMSVMAWANELADFDAPELDSAWID